MDKAQENEIKIIALKEMAEVASNFAHMAKDSMDSDSLAKLFAERVEERLVAVQREIRLQDRKDKEAAELKSRIVPEF